MTEITEAAMTDHHPTADDYRNLRSLAPREGVGGRLTPTGKRQTPAKGVRSAAA